MEHLINQIKRHEGMELKPYRCTSEKLTIGIGRNLEDVGISEDEAHYLLKNDIERVYEQMNKLMPWSLDLNPARRDALANFIFNVGIGTALKFVNAMEALKQGNFDTAADEMLDSRWANQVGKRSLEIASQIREGEYKDG